MTPGSEVQKFRSLPIVRKQKQSRILLIEGEPDTRDMVSLLLDSQGYDVIAATNAAEACRLMQDNQFAFILFDWFLRGEPGTVLCKMIRSFDSQTPIYFYTGVALKAGVEKGIEADAQRYSAQPVGADAVLNTIFLHMEKIGRQSDQNRP